MTDNQELILDEGAWQKIKDHVARNKGKYAALAGGALAAGLGYAANKGMLGQGAQDFTQKAIASSKDLLSSVKDKFASKQQTKSTSGGSTGSSTSNSADSGAGSDSSSNAGGGNTTKTVDNTIRSSRTGSNPTPEFKNVDTTKLNPRHAEVAANGDKYDLAKKAYLAKLVADKGKPQTVVEKIAAAQGDNTQLPAGVTPTKPKAIEQMEKRIADKGKVTAFDKLKGTVSKEQNLLNQIASGKGYDKIDTQTALDKGVSKAKDLGQKLKEGFINLNKSVDKNAANYEAQEKKLGTSTRNLFTKPLRG